jgi:uncharacterized membrane protein YfcA
VSAAAAAYGGADSRWGRFWVWLGHYSTQVSLVAVPVIWMGPATTALFFQHGDRVPRAATVVLVAAVVASMVSDVAGWRHDGSLCLRDGDRTPLDPQAEVTRWRRRLRVRHNPLILYASGVAVLGWALVQPYLLWGAPMPVRLAASAGAAVVCVGTVWLTVLAPATHRRLRPWCPQCHWDGGGEEEPSPVPTPDPVGVVTR